MFWESGLVHTHARLYNPAIGRWLSPDPTVPDLYDGQGFNRYSYVLNNPTSLWDPQGFEDFTITCDPGDTCLPKMRVSANYIPCPPGMVGQHEPNCYNFMDFMPGGGPGGGGFQGGGGGRGGASRNPQQPKQQECTAAQQAATQLAQSLEHVKNVAGALALASGVGTVVAGVGEGFTVGFDTPVTVSFGAATSFFTGTSFATGTLAAGLNSFASGNLSALQGFDVNHLAGIAAGAAASKIPGLSSWSETVERLTEQVADLANTAQEACQ